MPKWIGMKSGGMSCTLGVAYKYDASHQRIVELAFDSMNESGTSGTSAWTPLHFKSRKIYASDGSAEFDYKNTITSVSDTSARWTLSNVRVYIPSPAGRVGSAELIPSQSGISSHNFYIYNYDRQGSIRVLTKLGNGNGQRNSSAVEDKEGLACVYGYSAWGERRNPKMWNSDSESSIFTYGKDKPNTSDNEDDPIPRGFTGHEMLDDIGLIHMNGRIYDPQLCRFLSPDPLIQNPYDLQSYNRYSYCLNNPLKYTDPTGYYSVLGLEYQDGGGLTGFARDSLKYVGAASTGAAEGLTDPVRLEGVAKMANGTLEMMASAPLLASGVGTAGGAVLAYQGGDLAGAGLMQALTGVSTETTIHQIGEATAKTAGASEVSANIVGTATEMAVGLGGAASVSRLSASAVRSAASNEVNPTVAATKVAPGGAAENVGANSAMNARNLARQLTSEEQMAQAVAGKGTTLVGAGSGSVLRDAPRLAKQYGGDAADWAKMASESSARHGVQTPSGVNFETHWYQNTKTGQVVEIKVKIANE